MFSSFSVDLLNSNLMEQASKAEDRLLVEERKNNTISNEMKQLKEDVATSKRIITELRSELHTMTLRGTTMNESKDRMNNKITVLNRELEDERIKVNQLREDNSTNMITINKMTTTIATLKSERNILNSRMNNLIKETDQESKSATDERKRAGVSRTVIRMVTLVLISNPFFSFWLYFILL